MNETHTSFGRLGQYIVRKTIEIIGNRVHRIDHDSLGRAGMRALALERDCRRARAPRLVADFSKLFAVHSLSHLRAETFYVTQLHTTADFFVGSKSDRYAAVFELRILTQDVDHRHDLRTARLII